MADFPLGIGRGANSNVVHRLRANSVPNFAFAPRMSWSTRLDHKQIKVAGGAALTLALTHASTIFDKHISTEFPENVVRCECTVRVLTAFAGTTTLVLEVGDAADPNGVFTSTSLMSVATTHTVAAAENTPRFESAFVPRLLFTATVENLEDLTAGEVEVEIAYVPVPVLW